jgi:hypothetical protein
LAIIRLFDGNIKACGAGYIGQKATERAYFTSLSAAFEFFVSEWVRYNKRSCEAIAFEPDRKMGEIRSVIARFNLV